MVLLVAATGMFAGCAGGPSADHAGADRSATATAATPANPYEQQRRQGVQALLDRWADAMRRDDETTLRSLVDPHAAPGFLGEQLTVARNLRGVPLGAWRYTIGAGPEVPVPAAVADRLDATDVWAPPVELNFVIAGADATPAGKPVGLIVARHEDTWLLVSDDEMAPYGRRTWQGPWNFGPVVARTVPGPGEATSVVLGHPEQSAEIDALAADLPSSVAAVTAFWGGDWPRRAVVIATGSDAELTALAGAARSGTDVAAVTVSDSVAAAGGPVTGLRVVFGPAGSDRLTPLTRRIVLTHELTHVATRSVTATGAPLWIVEGTADYVGYRDSGLSTADSAPLVAALVAEKGPPNALPTDADFAGPDAELAYELARTATGYVAARYGPGRLRTLYLALAGAPADATTLDGRLRAVLGVGTAQFIAGWGVWLSAQLGR
ncbi:hypothetical protein G4X40_17560 [Rhodococcus sp. D2-41]|uniref:hypothetical protein n=1 Tax=Speluncibacter jeojiensis TaxID=2710754 RepID=UPI00240EAA62|nr:hypothetical protein [Rhodococcus sp. D2-41]MDG3011952.1 hypothetical protein [Rhodococcus sp. D2-41]